MSSSSPPSKFSQEAAAPAARQPGRPAPPELRATLDGLDVQPAPFDAWLSAGGERRRQPRGPGKGSAKR
jgi:hypothetical protein